VPQQLEIFAYCLEELSSEMGMLKLMVDFGTEGLVTLLVSDSVHLARQDLSAVTVIPFLTIDPEDSGCAACYQVATSGMKMQISSPLLTVSFALTYVLPLPRLF
jgi:hypothetical protein